MKRILFIFAIFFAMSVSAQTKPVTKKSEVKKEKTAKSKTKTKAGKVDPNEKGSGITIPKQDQPTLDKKPNPASTIPSKELPADENPKP